MVVETSVGFDTSVEAFPPPRGKKVDVAFFNAFHPLKHPQIEDEMGRVYTDFGKGSCRVDPRVLHVSWKSF